MTTIFKMLAGSRAYGLSTPTSDVDNRGVFLNDDLRYVLGLDKHDNQEYTAGGADDKFKEFRRYLQLLREANTEALEMLFAEYYDFCDPLFHMVRDNRFRLLDSERLFTALKGYMQGELRRANGELKGKLGKRRDSLEKYGYSPKNFVQLLRLSWAGSVFFLKGYFPVDVSKEAPSYAQTLLSIKTEPEKWSVFLLNDMAAAAEVVLKESFEKRSQTFKFDGDFANEMVLRAYYPMLDKEYMKIAIREVCEQPTAEQVSAGLIQECDCEMFKFRIGITIDSQDLYEGGYRECPFCKKPFARK